MKRTPVVVDKVNMPDNEDRVAKDFWKNNGVKQFYRANQPWSKKIYEVVSSIPSKSIFEFGCNQGRNLKYIKDQGYTGSLFGIDINKKAIDAGKKLFNLNLQYGDEISLLSLPKRDIVFTVSVFDHMPNPKGAVENLVKLANKLAVFLEIRLEREGKIIKYLEGNKEISAIEATYSWHLEKLIPGIDVKREPYTLPGVISGEFYMLYTIKK